jgi:hypothetical protein
MIILLNACANLGKNPELHQPVGLKMQQKCDARVTDIIFLKKN